MLSGQEIRELIAVGSLKVEPILEDFQIAACSFDIRIGRSVLLGDSPTSPRQIEIGRSVRLEPGTHIRFVSLETLEFPDGISGMVFLWSGFASIGLFMPPSRIDPGWRGKLVLGIVNLSSTPVALVSGQRIASISLFKLGTASSTKPGIRPDQFIDYVIDSGVLSPELHFDTQSGVVTRSFRTGELSSLDDTLRLLLSRTQPLHDLARASAASLFGQVFSETDPQRKGRALEDFVEAILRGVRGLRIIKRDARLQAEELDFIVQNDVDSVFFRTLGSPVVVECKNWSGTVGAAEISLLAAKMEALSPDVKGGILVAPNGISGDAHRDAQLRRREFRQKGRYIVVLDRDDLKRAVEGDPVVRIVEEKYGELYLI